MILRASQSASMTKNESNRDGGRAALSGFLYQMVGAIGLKACCTIEPRKGGLEGLFELVNDPDCKVYHEGYDSDVAIVKELKHSAAIGVTLVQFKYSSSGQDARISPSNYVEILDRLRAAANRVLARGGRVSGYYLITNRIWSPHTRNIVNNIELALSQNKLTPEQADIARKLRLRDRVEPEVWKECVNQYGKQYGLRDDEIRNGRGTLLDRIMAYTVEDGPYSVDTAVILECLTGTRDARQLVHNKVLPTLSTELDVELGAKPEHSLVKRRQQEDFFIANSNRAIILLWGGGGMGKTAILREWMRNRVSDAFVAASRPLAVTDNWISSTVNRWRNVTATADSTGAALARLREANPGAALPILHLAVDGIDEGVSPGCNYNNICRLVQWFLFEDRRVQSGMKAEPDAQLVVTCRDLEDFEQFWLPHTAGSPGTKPAPPPNICFDKFSDNEIAELAHLEKDRLGDGVYRRLLLTTGGELGILPEDAGDDAVENTDHKSPHMDSLRHPAIWEAFIAAPPDIRMPFMDGHVEAANTVARFYVDRVIKKAVLRCDGLAKMRIKKAFAALAIAAKGKNPSNVSMALWHCVLVEGLGLGSHYSEVLYNECLSSGIIETDGSKWRWCYPFVGHHLASLDNQGGVA